MQSAAPPLATAAYNYARLHLAEAVPFGIAAAPGIFMPSKIRCKHSVAEQTKQLIASIPFCLRFSFALVRSLALNNCQIKNYCRRKVFFSLCYLTGRWFVCHPTIVPLSSGMPMHFYTVIVQLLPHRKNKEEAARAGVLAEMLQRWRSPQPQPAENDNNTGCCTGTQFDCCVASFIFCTARK